MSIQHFSISFVVDRSTDEVFNIIKEVRNWWAGLYNEQFEGKSDKKDDEFSFRAGDGAHYSRQRLTEIIPGKRLVWLVTESELNFLKNRSEWTGTKIIFDIAKNESQTVITFTHEGLNPEKECFNSCAPAWKQYLTGQLLSSLQ